MLEQTNLSPAQRRRALCRRLRELEAARRQLAVLDEAVALLPPADKLILQKLILCPEKGNAALLCQLLEMEPCTLYRRRNRLLDTLPVTIEN